MIIIEDNLHFLYSYKQYQSDIVNQIIFHSLTYLEVLLYLMTILYWSLTLTFCSY